MSVGPESIASVEPLEQGGLFATPLDKIIAIGTIATVVGANLNKKITRRFFLRGLAIVMGAGAAVFGPQPVQAKNEAPKGQISRDIATELERLAEIKLNEIGRIQKLLEESGKTGGVNSADAWINKSMGTFGNEPDWLKNKQSIELAIKIAREHTGNYQNALGYLEKVSVNNKLKPADYLDFGKEKGRTKSTSIEVLSTTVTGEDIKKAKDLIKSFSFLGLKIFIFDKSDKSLKLPFKMSETTNTAYRIGETVYVARSSLDKLPHEALHQFEDQAHKYFNPNQFVAYEKYKAQLLTGDNGRLYPNNLPSLLEWSFSTGKWNEQKSFQREVNFYPAQIFFNGGDLSEKRAEVLDNSPINISWGNIDLRSASFVEFLTKITTNVQVLKGLNDGTLFGFVFSEVISKLPLSQIEENFKYGLGSNLDLKSVDGFKEIFRRLGDRAVATLLWQGGKEEALRKFMTQKQIDLAKERLAAMVKISDHEFIAESMRLVHLNKIGRKTDVKIPAQAEFPYSHIFESINN